MKNIFIIAGEKSGDNIGAKLIRSMKKQYAESEISFYGIGGEEMEKEGLKSLFPMREINFMGFLEIIPHLPNLINRINYTVSEILKINPQVVITIDSPGFNYRVAKKLRDKNFKGKLIHYVAPSVWAYKEKRAEKTAKLFDMLLCLLPWEPPYFEKHGLKTVYVGHPLFEDLNIISEVEKILLRKKLAPEGQKLISILAGSRETEVKKFLSIIKNALNLIRNNNDIKIAFLTVPHLENYLRENTKDINCIIESDISEKQKIIQASDFAIVKSGTVSLEVSALGCPQVVVYKINPISHFIIKSIVKIKYANLLNISANKEIITELIQNDFNAENLAKITLEFLDNPNISQEQLFQVSEELKKFRIDNGTKSSDLAARAVLTTAHKNDFSVFLF